MAKATEPLKDNKSSGGDAGKGEASRKPDKSGFGGGTVDPGLRSPFVDAVFKKS